MKRTNIKLFGAELHQVVGNRDTMVAVFIDEHFIKVGE